MVKMLGERVVNFVSEEASPYVDSNVTVVEEDYESEEEAKRNVVFREDQAPCENQSPKVSSNALSKQDSVMGSRLLVLCVKFYLGVHPDLIGVFFREEGTDR